MQFENTIQARSIVDHVRKTEDKIRNSLDHHWNNKLKNSQDNYIYKLNNEQ